MPVQDNYRFLKGDGEMGRLIREFHWENTSLGPVDKWPQSLKTTLSILIHSKFPMFLWWGPENICFYNDAYRPSLGNEGKHPSILGMAAIEAWPEIWDFIQPLIDSIRAGGEATFDEDLLLPIFRNGKIEDVYWTFSYSPVIDETNTPAGVFVTCSETTEKVKLVSNLLLSEQRFHHLVSDATVGIIALTGNDWNVEVVNAAYGKLINRTVQDLLNRPLFEVLPEAGHDFRPILESVLSSGEPLYLFEHPYFYHLNQEKKDGYLNLVYQPYRDQDGMVKGVMVLCQDVTDQVTAKTVLETSLEQIRLSKEAAKLGTFDLDLIKGTMEWDQRCRVLFGITHDGVVSYEKDFLTGLHPEDRKRIAGIIDKLFDKSLSDGDYDVEYRTIGVEDQQLRWVRAKGKVYFNKQDQPVRFIGSVLDITQQKLEEFRKNDFVAIVSHELKTPLTSLNGILQLAERKVKSQEDQFLTEAIHKAMVQVKKMNNMITGFLNLSRFESGNMHLDPAEFYLSELIQDAVKQIKFTTEAEIIYTSFQDLRVYADKDKIESVITNLLTNAVKYSPKNSSITVTCRLENENALIAVSDQGFGINKVDLENIFERYYRVQNNDTKNVSGFGVGLYLSAEIIRMHQGSIWASSEKDRGSTFYFTLPLSTSET
ncbi:ATP-binding protein [Mucilaginibacter sp.]|uniref:PAS domain-containing sensor histidine kinase n=1 Tax=Mucilaginibacter sp. TaxID=1882438 RepID=UPI0035BC4156